VAATHADLAACGIILSQPPLRAPVLAQHTLAYLFSARPQDRASYFKAILEVTDLEDFRGAVAALAGQIKLPTLPLLEKLKLVTVIPGVDNLLSPLLQQVPSASELEEIFEAALQLLIEQDGQVVPDELSGKLAKTEQILAEKRTKAFPFNGFDKRPLAAWSHPTAEQITTIRQYLEERAKVDEETRRLTSLFREALALPSIASATANVDCPLCTAESSLTVERVAFIRQQVANTEGFRKAERAAADSLTRLQSGLQSVINVTNEALPRFITTSGKVRRQTDFRVCRITELLGESATCVDPWLSQLRTVTRLRAAATREAGSLLDAVTVYVGTLDSLTDLGELINAIERTATCLKSFAEALPAYLVAEEAVLTPLLAIIDAEGKTAGWQELIELAGILPAFRSVLIEHIIHEEAGTHLEQALRQIDRGNEAVLEAKFQTLSDSVQDWWDLLRPDELSFFNALKPRAGARRTIDFKAGLSILPDRSDPKLRDVIAVFSQSQLHCLGLALFIARAIHEGVGFLVLDDPILSSDDDYRAHFNASVLEQLIELGVQVILLTQDQRTFKDLTERYLHQNIGTFHIALQNPAQGSIVNNTADDLATLLSRSEILIRGGHPDLHKQGGEMLRDAAERFCKELLVKDRRRNGDRNVSLSDFDGQNLGQLSPRVEPLLTGDAAHPGKLRTIGSNTNPANHDDTIPPAGVLKVALGDLRSLKKQYL
jgi:hypothetical protein